MTLFERDQYAVECPAGSDTALVRGVLRLGSPAAYDSVFAPVRDRIVKRETSTIDLTGVTFMNSSGIRALASLVLLAKDAGVSLCIVASERVPWQKKTVASFRAMSPGLSVQLR